MESLLTHLGLALLTFAVTNVDDLLLLSLYFSNPVYKTRTIVVGQYLGITTLIAVSLLGFMVGTFVEERWVGLLGFVPILIGLKDLWKQDSNQDNLVSQSPAGNKQIISIALITIANGGDNIGVYTPLFASLPASVVITYVLIFLLMVGVWCFLGYYSVKHHVIQQTLAKYGHWILPFFLIMLGAWIIYESKAYTLVYNLLALQKAFFENISFLNVLY
jgi:cadmium resistance transport/sequestration family protein